MQFVPSALAFLLPLIILPGWSYYYDVTPKAVLVLAAAATLLAALVFETAPRVPRNTPALARWTFGVATASLLLLLVSAASSPHAALAWQGSTWCRMGAIAQAAVLVCALLGARQLATAGALRWFLRSLCVAGLAAGGYAIVQYFGWDPLQSAAGYHFGEGAYEIVRPPATMGHSDYLAAFLLWPAFAGCGLLRIETARVWRTFSVAAASVASLAILISGSRGALLGFLAGAIVLVALQRPRLRAIAACVLGACLAAGAFYVSPAGTKLRARAFWISEDTAGGARLLLWRDTLAMSAERPFTGFGPDTFEAAFPQHESTDLARAFPEFYHESPHNIFLDALISEGMPGLALLAAWIVLGVFAARRALAGPHRQSAIALTSGLAGALVAQQFVVFVLPTMAILFLAIATLSELAAPSPPFSRSMAVPACACAVLLLFFAVRWSAADVGLARIDRAIQAGDLTRTADLLPGAHASPADLGFSRRLFEIATQATDVRTKLLASQLAAQAALAATRSPEQQANAWYSLASIQAAANDASAVESSLRRAAAVAPRWYKPHWTLARLLALTSRFDEAAREASLALDLNGQRDPEVTATAAAILRSARGAP